MFREMRRFKQQLSEEECRHILKTEKRGVLAVNGDGGYPYTIPINYIYEEESGKIYFHGAKEGHKIDALLRRMVRGAVSPASMRDVVEDWLAE